jgi:anti-sigma factor RsiW
MSRIPFFDCRACVERLSEFLDGELPRAARFVTAVHLRWCKDCRVHAEQMRATVALLHAQGSHDEPLRDETKRALLEALSRGSRTDE